MLHRDGADVALGIQFEQRVLIQIARLGNARRAELDQQRVRVMKNIKPSWLEPSVKESVVYCLPVGEQDNPEIAIVHLGYLAPAPDTAILLDHLPYGCLDRTPVGQIPAIAEVTCDLHTA